jgi:hypothetical protein
VALRLLSIALWVLLFGCIVLFALAFLLEREFLPFRLLGNLTSRPSLEDKIAPVLIILLSGWVIVEVAVRAWNVRRQHVANLMFRSFVEDANLDEYEPGGSGTKLPRAVRRANLIAECHRRDPSSLHESVPAAAGIDANELANSYTSMHVYAWVLPVLGFIGTAAGLASAIGGFKDALGVTSRTDALVSSLSQLVIPGLAGAFEVTMLALAASGVTYIIGSALRSWDQEALDELDRLSLVLLSRVPSPAAAEAKDLLRLFNELSSKLRDTFHLPDNLTGAVNAIAAAAQDISSASERSSNAIYSAASTLSTASEQLRDAALLPYQISITRGEPR